MKILQILVAVTLIFLPLYVIRCKNFSWCSSSVPFTLLEVLILITFAAWVVWKVYLAKKGEKVSCSLYESLRRPFFWPLVVFLILATFSLFISPDIRSAAGIWKAYFIEPALLFIVITDLASRKKSLNWLILPMIFSGLWVSAIAIWQVIADVPHFSLSLTRIERVTSVYNTPNSLGLYLGPLFLLTSGFLAGTFKSRKYGLQKVVLISFLSACLISFFLTIYLSGSRGALWGLLFSVLFFFSLAVYSKVTKKIKNLLKITFFLGIVAFLAGCFFYFINIDKIVAESSQEVRNSYISRLCMWQGTKRIVSEKAITGIGLSGFPAVYPRYATCEPFHYQYPHNIFLNFWAELGLFGLAAFLWITFKYVEVISKVSRSFLAFGLFSVIVYIFIHGLVDVPYFKNDLSVQFWVFLAMVGWFDN